MLESCYQAELVELLGFDTQTSLWLLLVWLMKVPTVIKIVAMMKSVPMMNILVKNMSEMYLKVLYDSGWSEPIWSKC